MKRIIAETILALVLVGVAIYGYIQHNEITKLEKELVQVQEFQEESEKLQQQLSDSAVELTDLRVKAQILQATRVALSSGIALSDIEAAAQAEQEAQAANTEGDTSPSSGTPSEMNPDRLLAVGALRMLIFGQSDQKALASFQKALEMVDLKSKLKAVCAAQAGIAASGRPVSILSECSEQSE